MIDKATEASIVISKTKMFNNPDVCIKDFKSTFACVCKECIAEHLEEIHNILEREYPPIVG